MKPLFITTLLVSFCIFGQSQDLANYLSTPEFKTSSPKDISKKMFSVNLNSKINFLEIENKVSSDLSFSYFIYNTSGLKIQSGSFTTDLFLDVSSLSTGNYSVKLINQVSKDEEVHEFVVE